LLSIIIIFGNPTVLFLRVGTFIETRAGRNTGGQ
jgi:hypothetical protein